MSRIGKNPVAIPSGVDVTIDGQTVTAKGKLGSQSVTLVDVIEPVRDGESIVIKKREESPESRKMWGTMRSCVQNAVTGVSEGFTKKLEIVGVGYRAQVAGKNLQLQLGFSHDVIYPIPDGITIECEKQTSIAVSGANKQQVGQVAAEIRRYRPPEPFKGKGVRYEGEYILRKEGKKK